MTSRIIVFFHKRSQTSGSKPAAYRGRDRQGWTLESEGRQNDYASPGTIVSNGMFFDASN